MEQSSSRSRYYAMGVYLTAEESSDTLLIVEYAHAFLLAGFKTVPGVVSMLAKHSQASTKWRRRQRRRLMNSDQNSQGIASIADEKVQYILDNYPVKIHKEFGPAEVWLFGSRIHGEPDEYSDVDMVLVSDRFNDVRFLDSRQLFREVTGIAEDRNAEVVDVLCYTPEEFAELSSRPTVIREAVEKGVKVE